jgi:radical SAM superfamily enzyme YgiQ (UPF0313 family)
MKKKRILIINCGLDEFRLNIRRVRRLPFSMAPAYLAGILCPEHCDVVIYDEIFSGPLEDEKRLSWPDMLILTGMNSTFDRMLHLTAYARTKNKKVIVIAGGPVIRNIPKFAGRFFDYPCTGDIEQLQFVIEEAFGRQYVSRAFLEKGWSIPRYDLAYFMKDMVYVESSRYCNYRCNYCGLSAENKKYQPYDLAYLKEQFEALGKRKLVLFLDNNFGGTHRDFLLERLELLKELREKKSFWRWSALVSNDFFFEDENLELARKSGCVGLFSGVESFNEQALLNFNKHQNVHMPQVDLIKKCLEAGINFFYGMLVDVSTRSLKDIKQELEFLLDTPQITLPAFITTAIPLLGTPFFFDCFRQKRFLPNVKLRDLDGKTLALKSVDPLPKVVQFIKDIQCLAGYRSRILRHQKEFFRIYRKRLPPEAMFTEIYNSLLLATPNLATAPTDIGRVLMSRFKYQRTYLSTTEALDPAYTPAFQVDACYESYFKPTMLTDSRGNLAEALQEDLAAKVPPDLAN